MNVRSNWTLPDIVSVHFYQVIESKALLAIGGHKQPNKLEQCSIEWPKRGGGHYMTVGPFTLVPISTPTLQAYSKYTLSVCVCVCVCVWVCVCVCMCIHVCVSVLF